MSRDLKLTVGISGMGVEPREVAVEYLFRELGGEGRCEMLDGRW